MPRKCCTFFNGECCRTNYAATKTKPLEGGTLYKFPENPDERQRWIQSLPNQSKSLKITNNIRICYKHFPPDCPKKIVPAGALVPTVAPFDIW